MRGAKANAVDEDYEVGADKEDKQGSSDKPLSSQYRGVCWNRKNKRWQAAINSGGKYVYLGSFLSEYDAARAFDKAAVKLRGTRAKLNFAYSEYVDEKGNLLEDPKMKNVMYKIEVMQGCNGGGGGGAGHSKHDSGSDHDGAHGPIPLLEDGGGAAAAHRQLPPFAQTEVGSGKAGGNTGTGSDWHGMSRGLQIMLAGGNGGAGALPPFPEGGAPGQALPLPAGPSGPGPAPAGPSRNRTPGLHAGQQAALQMLQELSPYSGQGAAANVAAGGGGGAFAALGLSVNAAGDQTPPPARVQAVNATTQRAIMRELKPSCQILAYVPVPSRYSSREEMCGVLFHDTESPGLIGSAAWTGSTLLMMGMYDTDRDARQAAIKCMQLYNAFCKEEWRVDFYNALTAMGGDQYTYSHPNNQHQHGGVKGQRDPAQHPQSSVAAAGGSSNNNNNADGGVQAAGGPLPLPGAYGPRTSARGSNSSSLADTQLPHGAGTANQEPAPAPPYARTSGGGASAGAGFGGGDNGPGRSGPSQPPVSGGFGQQQLPLESGGEGPSGSAAVIPLGAMNPPTVLTELFHYMANFKSKSTGDAGDEPTSAAHGGTGAGTGSALGKRSAPGDCPAQQQGPSQQQQQQHEQQQQQQRALQLEEAQRQQQQHEAEEQRRDVKRIRLDPTAGGALDEFREAHKLPLAALVKHLEQAAAGR